MLLVDVDPDVATESDDGLAVVLVAAMDEEVVLVPVVLPEAVVDVPDNDRLDELDELAEGTDDDDELIERIDDADELIESADDADELVEGTSDVETLVVPDELEDGELDTELDVEAVPKTPEDAELNMLEEAVEEVEVGSMVMLVAVVAEDERELVAESKDDERPGRVLDVKLEKEEGDEPGIVDLKLDDVDETKLVVDEVVLTTRLMPTKLVPPMSPSSMACGRLRSRRVQVSRIS